MIHRNWHNNYAYLHECINGTNNGESYLSDFIISETVDRISIKFDAEASQLSVMVRISRTLHDTERDFWIISFKTGLRHSWDVA
jgi:hypothetical protein